MDVISQHSTSVYHVALGLFSRSTCNNSWHDTLELRVPTLSRPAALSEVGGILPLSPSPED